MLSLKNIKKSFGQEGENNFRTVLNALDFGMEKGESVAILGPSGSGKTTLLNIIGALDHADEGEQYFDGQDVRKMTSSEIDHFRNQKIGFVFQLHHLLPQLNLLENILMPTLAGSTRSHMTEKAEALLNRVGIWEHRFKLPGKMSGGECQRAAVVRAIINSPALLLADEPTGALDRKNAAMISELLLDLNKNEGLGLLVVTHSTELASGMGKLYQLEQGKLKQA